MDERSRETDILGKVCRVALLVIILVLVVVTLGIATGPMVASRELRKAQQHRVVIEQLAEAEDWAQIKDYMDENDLYGYEYQKYLDVYETTALIKSIENGAKQMEKYADTPLSDYYTQKDKDAKMQERAKEMVEDMQECYQRLRRDVYDSAIEGNEFELLELLKVLEKRMASYGISEDQIARMCREDSYQFEDSGIFDELVTLVLSYYTVQ